MDFYQPANKLVIELDGSQHGMEQGIAADNERDTVLSGFNLTVLRFWNSEVDNNFEGVCEKIIEHTNAPF